MAFSGGVYTLPGPALNTGDTVSATENNTFRNDVATALNLTWLRNGTATATANLPMGGYKLTGLGAGTTNGDSVRYEQLPSATNKLDLTTSVTGTLPVSNGGTGAATLTGIVKGNGTSAFTAATAGTDYGKPDTASTWSAKQTFSTTTKIQQTLEKITISATASTGTINYDCLTQAALYYTTDASGNFTVNFRGDGSNSLDSIMATGESLTLAFLCSNGATPYYNSAVTIDGNSVTPKWQGGSAPTSGKASSVDMYVYNIVKTGSATFTVFAAQTQFK